MERTKSRSGYENPHHLFRIDCTRIPRRPRESAVIDCFGKRHVSSEVYAPQSEAVRIHIATIRHRVHCGAQLGDFLKTQRGTTAARPVCGKIKQEYVVLMILKGRSEREQFSAARFVARAKHDRGSGFQARKEPAVARPFPRHGIGKRLGVSGEILQIDFGVALRGRNHFVNQIARNRRRRQQSKENKSQNGNDELGVPRRGISQFGNETHALEFVAVERAFAQPVDSLGGLRDARLANVSTVGGA